MVALDLQEFQSGCGYLYISSISTNAAEITYYPTQDVLDNPGVFYRGWRNAEGELMQLQDNVYEERKESLNTKYILTLYNYTASDAYFLECFQNITTARTNMVYMSEARLQLGPVCTVDGCKDCVCVYPGHQITCAATVPDVRIKIDKNDVSLYEIGSNGSIHTFETENITISSYYHMKTVECWTNTSNIHGGMSTRTHIFVIGNITLGPLCDVDGCTGCVCVYPGDTIICTAFTPNVKLSITDVDVYIYTRQNASHDNMYTYESDNVSIDSSFHLKTVKCWVEMKGEYDVVETSAKLYVISRPKLGPLCSVGNCTDCLCIYPSDSITCAASTTNVNVRIDGSDVTLLPMTSNGTTYSFESVNFTIGWLHHMTLVECWSNLNGTLGEIYSRTKMFVLARPKLGPTCTVDGYKDSVCVFLDEAIICTSNVPNLHITINNVTSSVYLSASNGTFYTYSTNKTEPDSSPTTKIAECWAEQTAGNDMLYTSANLFLIARPRLGPLCSADVCPGCVCVFQNIPITCTSAYPDVRVRIDNVDVVINKKSSTSDGDDFIYETYDVAFDLSSHSKIVECTIKTNYTNDVSTRGELYIIERPVLGPVCRGDGCTDCVCVYPGEQITCTSNIPDVRIKMNGINLRLQEIRSNGTIFTYETSNITYSSSHHMETVTCFVTLNNTQYEMNTTVKLHVIARPIAKWTGQFSQEKVFIAVGVFVAVCVFGAVGVSMIRISSKSRPLNVQHNIESLQETAVKMEEQPPCNSIEMCNEEIDPDYVTISDCDMNMKTSQAGDRVSCTYQDLRRSRMAAPPYMTFGEIDESSC
ncbi:uncharacterized protein LOC127867882 isoform X2 [Dreissena polymorpha]|nr:uncharacterized protein LOC127867882 isoform X2 [Dreissena polymorpha]